MQYEVRLLKLLFIKQILCLSTIILNTCISIKYNDLKIILKIKEN